MKTAGGMLALVASVAGCSGGGSVAPAQWFAKDAVHYLDQVQVETRTRAIAATGDHGAATVAYGPFAARAGLAVLERGGNAMDAALTTAVTQVAVTAGSPVSYFGIMALVYYDAKTGRISTMNAGWNTIKGDTDPLTIPGSIDLGKNVLGTAVSGRTALVGGFMKGVESAHRRFGRREDLAAYDVIWSDPLVRQVGDIEIASLPAPNEGGVALIEAQQLALAAGLGRGGHWSGSGEVLKQTLSIALARMVTYLPDEVQKKRYPDVRFDAESRMTAANARAYWGHLARGETPLPIATAPKHSDDVVVIDAEGNMAAITHSINCGRDAGPGVLVDGVGSPRADSAGPGERLPLRHDGGSSDRRAGLLLSHVRPGRRWGRASGAGRPDTKSGPGCLGDSLSGDPHRANALGR